jgi:hypothetical protein
MKNAITVAAKDLVLNPFVMSLPVKLELLQLQ